MVAAPARQQIVECGLGDEVERTYQLFLDRVEAGRPIPRDAIEKVARGRVWTGVQAKEHGLVDELGGLYASVGGIRERLSLAPDAEVALMVYPSPRPLAEQIAMILQGVVARAAAPSLPVSLPAGLAALLEGLELFQPGAPMLLPPLVVEID